MKRFKKLIASLTSAAMVFGMVSLTPMSSFAASMIGDDWGMDANGELQSSGISVNYYDSQTDTWIPSDDMWMFRGPAEYDSIVCNKTNKTITFTNFAGDTVDSFGYPSELYPGIGSDGYTYIFDGTSVLFAMSIDVEDTDINLSLTPGSKLTIKNCVEYYKEGFENHVTLLEGTIISKNSTDSDPIMIIEGSSNSTSTISDDEEETTSADETDDSTDGDTTGKTDDATTDDTTSDDSSDDETTTGDSSDDETESPNVIEGKNLSWNTVDSTGKSYWYENGVKQGTVDDPKAVSYDGAVRGREIYDPESKEWYWLDANSNGARAVNKEVFVPYIYQDQSKLSADEIKALAKLSDNGLDGVGGTVYSAMINKTGKWIRYDAKGAMIKGWYTVEGADAELYPTQKGNTYYYDTKTGTMAKGDCVIDGVLYHFDGLTGALKK